MRKPNLAVRRVVAASLSDFLSSIDCCRSHGSLKSKLFGASHQPRRLSYLVHKPPQPQFILYFHWTLTTSRARATKALLSTTYLLFENSKNLEAASTTSNLVNFRQIYSSSPVAIMIAKLLKIIARDRRWDSKAIKLAWISVLGLWKERPRGQSGRVATERRPNLKSCSRHHRPSASTSSSLEPERFNSAIIENLESSSKHARMAGPRLLLRTPTLSIRASQWRVGASGTL